MYLQKQRLIIILEINLNIYLTCILILCVNSRFHRGPMFWNKVSKSLKKTNKVWGLFEKTFTNLRGNTQSN